MSCHVLCVDAIRQLTSDAVADELLAFLVDPAESGVHLFPPTADKVLRKGVHSALKEHLSGTFECDTVNAQVRVQKGGGNSQSAPKSKGGPVSAVHAGVGSAPSEGVDCAPRSRRIYFWATVSSDIYGNL